MLLPRLLGATTIAFSAAIMAHPPLMAGPSGMLDRDGRLPRDVRLLMYAMGVRDMALGAAMLCAPSPRAMRVAVSARVAADLGDAVVFGLGLPRRRHRAAVAAMAGGWAAVCAASLRGLPAE
ncbi:hypothetical protein [Nocardiopsis trehalosi]|jgi:hypothetical protein|uniref:hypothetical protein n=1 Tax=Nocardiopsis trehalosi TaxID=109329 RepID=UPI0008325A83|nr:hypothetical protein [Nocardiopsis trehalosi]